MQIAINFHFTLLFIHCFLFGFDRFSQPPGVRPFTVGCLNQLPTKMLDMCLLLRLLLLCSMRPHCHVAGQSSMACHPRS